MGEYIGTVLLNDPPHGVKKKKAAKATAKSARGKIKIHFRVKIRNDPKRTQALVKALTNVAKKYRIRVRKKK